MSSSSSTGNSNMEVDHHHHHQQQLDHYGGGGGGGGGNTNPRRCAACKYLRRRCAADCVLAPYFPASQPRRYADVHAIFGTSNVTRVLQSLPVQERGRPAETMATEARWRVQDPVYGCTGVIERLQQEIRAVQHELATTRAQLAVQAHYGAPPPPPPMPLLLPPPPPPPPMPLAAAAAVVAAHAAGGGRSATVHDDDEEEEAPSMDPDEFLDLDGRL